jgi:hypothetical protein
MKHIIFAFVVFTIIGIVPAYGSELTEDHALCVVVSMSPEQIDDVMEAVEAKDVRLAAMMGVVLAVDYAKQCGFADVPIRELDSNDGFFRALGLGVRYRYDNGVRM